jgi:aspartyl-tRNA(Asn)/glutamyl-tRNA(Gln) amidotransferase subunit B
MGEAGRAAVAGRYEAVIGLEVHAQLATRTKLFCGCANAFGEAPNSRVCPVCLGLPGALPVLNRAAVSAGVRLALALGCAVQPESIFARKNYFYPDLPKGYQISQFDRPFAMGGAVEIESGGEAHAIPLIRIHLEEDAGKSLHEGFPDSDTATYLDFNRSGVPLCEIVSGPAIRSPEEAHAYLVRLRSVLTYLGVSSGNMEEGSFRCDANVSIRPRGQAVLGTRTELKNLNSFRNVQRAIEHEIERQGRVLEGGGRVIQETRLYDEKSGATVTMRAKEESHDYRYFPEPDLLPLLIPAEQVERIRADLPELPAARRRRFIETLGLAAAAADLLTLDKGTADFFEQVARGCGDPRLAANWITGEVAALAKETPGGLAALKVSAADLGTLLDLLRRGVINAPVAREVLSAVAAGEGSPEAIIRERGLGQIGDEDVIARAVAEALAAHPAQVEQYRQGKTQVLGFFVGRIMRATGGRASPEVLNRLLRAALDRPPGTAS